ncbi:MAG: hypothetical protein HY319_28995 [Armatimonadetes bacterium]|nr:hypothetical protein [Armatimonadota bacterium]
MDARLPHVHEFTRLRLREDGAVYVYTDQDLTVFDGQGHLCWSQPMRGSWRDLRALHQARNSYVTQVLPRRRPPALERHPSARQPRSRGVLRPRPRPDVAAGRSPGALRILDANDGRILHTEPVQLAFGEPPFLTGINGEIYATTGSPAKRSARFPHPSG